MSKRKLALELINWILRRGETSSTGNVARQAFSESDYINCVLSLVDAQHRDSLLQIHTNASSILRIINSSQKVKTDLLETICKDTYLMILDKFPWASITLTLHKVLAHSEELLRESNSSLGLKNISEGSESCNKLIRRYREHLARKISFEANISDIFVRLVSESDPVLTLFRSKLVCEKCHTIGHTSRAKCCRKRIESSSIEIIVNSVLYD